MITFKREIPWFHISRTLHPFLKGEKIKNSVMLYPYVPLRGSNAEGNIPRICVSNQIYNCVNSIVGRTGLFVYDITQEYGYDKINFNKINNNKYSDDDIFEIKGVKNPYVYVSYENPFIPPNAVDFREHNERWFIYPTKFVLLGTLSLKYFIKNKIMINDWHKNKAYDIKITKKKYFMRLDKQKLIFSNTANNILVKTLIQKGDD